MKSILQFTLVMGAVSSIFDIVMFGLLIMIFRATPEAFRTAWFIESTATQILVIFVIRTHAEFASSRPSPVLVTTSLGALAAALLVVFSPLSPIFGFGELSTPILAAIATVVVGYLVSADRLKRLT
jgi:Mg2+-importing ATPase